ncbi:heme biosynthesis HemY N-terminal domain-containing protein [Shewanella glacialipiscicola]|uniref:Heme biosynthesis protein HemY n=1 Tax=Shewanella glacialipiscicola TaxID=614069 RepID=A0ABQ6IZS1_9GAMM|nr:heme biosynthesis HemY N-terminal domain-containing protein [Shewanella glacialipiscicola]MCL1086279.1 heme biosynthesis protein HemY [Shewanella glacialipiscicola]GIU04201.1 heme biosynthesis protein HemY [Shewanella glacialipiscicola]GMA80494.1 heme biosynthesis protein HemY [Shewanella glacialipiscicola]GMA84290.1 heme biosynthesis protein HemY [Shewanella glacialipiscicola]
MIKILMLLLIVLIGLCISPWLVGNTGYVYIAAGDYQIETSLVFGIIALIIFYAVFQILEWIVITAINLMLRSRFIPHHWRRRSAKKHTLMGALALAEEDWPAAERAMIKGADNGELPALNLLAAARAAQYQQKIAERDQYLNRAAAQPLAANAVTTTRTRYLLKQGELTLARVELDKLSPTSKSKAPVLKLALELHQAQEDWDALKLLLPILKKRQILDDTQLNELNIATHSALLQAATIKGEEALEQCWQWLPRSERNQSQFLAIYAMGLCRFNRKDQAMKLLSKKLRSSPEPTLLQAIPEITTAQDTEIRKELLKYEVTHENNADYQTCLAKLYQQTRDMKEAKICWQNVCRLEPTKASWLALARIQEQLGEQSNANQSYRQAANL